MHEKKSVCALFMELSKAFDLKNHKQKVVVNNSGSTTQTMFAGFPHGSIDTNRPHEYKSIKALECL